MKRRIAIAAVAAGLGGAAWLLLHDHRPEPAAVTEAEPSPAEPPAAEPVPPALRQTPPAPAPRPSDEIITSDGLPIMPVRGEPDGPVHPHPITPQHQRIFAENRLIANIEGAMDGADVPGMRRLLAQYRRDYPEDDNQLQDGYQVIADCIEHPGPPSRGAADRWLDLHNGSGAKRFVLRYCYDNR